MGLGGFARHGEAHKSSEAHESATAAAADILKLRRGILEQYEPDMPRIRCEA
jgi:hypothetical protein